MKFLNVLSKLFVVLLMALLVVILGIYVFYILHNAEWLIGDDAFMLRRTAFGIPFPLSESILPEAGFFRPFDYLHENVVLLFHSGMHNAFEHYIINVVSFVVCMGALLGILWIIVRPKQVLDYAIVVFGVLLIASRLIGIYINVFGPIFGVYTWHMLAVFFLCVFLKNNRVWTMVLSLLCWAYSMLIYENVCLVLGCMGFFPLACAYKQLNRRQRIYCFSLIGLTIAFLVSYLFVIYIPTIGESHYNPSHGEEVSVFENAKNILKGQKFLWLAAFVWLCRQIQMLRKKTQYHILYDTLLWAAGGMIVGGVVLRLNWAMYYYDAIILSLPSVVFFSMQMHEKYGKLIALFIVLFFAIVHSRRVPQSIQNNQMDRVNTAFHMNHIAKMVSNGWNVIWFENGTLEGYAGIQRDCRKEWTKNYIQYLMQNREWDFDSVFKDYTVVFFPKENYLLGEAPDFCIGFEESEIGLTSMVSYFVIN